MNGHSGRNASDPKWQTVKAWIFPSGTISTHSFSLPVVHIVTARVGVGVPALWVAADNEPSVRQRGKERRVLPVGVVVIHLVRDT